MDFHELVAAHRRGRSFADLAADSGGTVSKMVWTQWVAPPPSRPMPTTFPRPETMVGMSVALGVPQLDVLLAFARTLGMDV